MDRISLAACTTYEQLATMMHKVQGFVNSRPRLRSCHATPLTSAHLIFATSLGEWPPIRFNLQSKENALVDYPLLQISLDSFWSASTNEYLPSRRRHCLKSTEAPKLGKLVVIADSNLSRSQWELGTIVNLIQDKDGVTRTAKVRLVRNSELRTHAIQKLVPSEPHLAGEDVAPRAKHHCNHQVASQATPSSLPITCQVNTQAANSPPSAAEHLMVHAASPPLY